jgi:serine/threonine protein kinase
VHDKVRDVPQRNDWRFTNMILNAEADVNQFYDVSNKIIGKGAFGTVVEGTKREKSNVKVAIKIIKLGNQIQSQIASIRAEVESLKCLNHPNIVKLHDFYETDATFHICMEIVEGGELFDRITQKNFYSEKDARDLVSILISALKHCHDQNIVHRDVKAENLLMVSDNDDADVKLVDFGFATKADGMSLEGVLGTADYMAPEIWGGKMKYGAPVDMWALGVLSFIILVGYPPFYDKAPLRLRTKICRGKFEFEPQYWANISEEAKDFVTRLLTVDMNARMTAEEALQHPWLALNEAELAAHKLEESIIQMKKFNARRRLKSSFHAVLAVGKMSRMLSAFKCQSGSKVNDSCDLGSESTDSISMGKADFGSTLTPSDLIPSSEDAHRRSSFILKRPNEDDDLDDAVRKKIEQLERENEGLLLTLANNEMSKCSIESGKDIGVIGDKDDPENPTSVFKMENKYQENSSPSHSSVIRSDSIDISRLSLEENSIDISRLSLEENIRAIKSLQMNLRSPL